MSRLSGVRPVLVPVLVGGLVAVLVGLGWASWSYRRMADAAIDARFAPLLADPPPGPRSPRSDAFGVQVGRTTMAEAQALARKLGVDCPDTSARALMAGARAHREREAEERKRKGLPPDAVSGASKRKGPSPMERNPQVRLSCEGLATSLLTDRTRAAIAEGRLLFVFDRPDQPLRHVSYQRTLPDPDLARRELDAAVADYRKLYGPPTKTPTTPSGPLPWLSPVDYEWNFTDLTVRLAALNFGGTRGTMLTELVEVPLPLRPNAPTDPR